MGVCVPGGAQVCVCVCVSRMCVCLGRSPEVCVFYHTPEIQRQTPPPHGQNDQHTLLTENITFPQLLLRAVIIFWSDTFDELTC